MSDQMKELTSSKVRRAVRMRNTADASYQGRAHTRMAATHDARREFAAHGAHLQTCHPRSIPRVDVVVKAGAVRIARFTDALVCAENVCEALDTRDVPHADWAVRACRRHRVSAPRVTRHQQRRMVNKGVSGARGGGGRIADDSRAPTAIITTPRIYVGWRA